MKKVGVTIGWGSRDVRSNLQKEIKRGLINVVSCRGESTLGEKRHVGEKRGAVLTAKSTPSRVCIAG